MLQVISFFSKSSQHTGKRPHNPGASLLLTLKSEAITEQKERVPAGRRGQRDDDLWLLWTGLWGPGARASVLEGPGDQALCGSLATEWPGLLLAVPVGSLPQVLPLPLSFHSIPPLPVFPSGLAAATSVTAYPPGWVELSLPKAGPFQLTRSLKKKKKAEATVQVSGGSGIPDGTSLRGKQRRS